jgi:hypothetical protein
MKDPRNTQSRVLVCGGLADASKPKTVVIVINIPATIASAMSISGTLSQNLTELGTLIEIKRVGSWL